MSLADGLLLAVAGLLAGAVNSVAGGGSLISFPALVLAGYPTLTANATNILAVTPGYVGTILGYRAELVGQAGRVRRLGSAAALGGLAGATLLLLTPGGTFDLVAPLLVLVAVVLLLAQPRLRALRARGDDARADGGAGAGDRSPLLLAAVALMAVYGGYFGAGLGIMFLAGLAILVVDDLQRLNALKSVLSLSVSIAAALALAFFGPIDWYAFAVVAVASLIGGRLGAIGAKRLDATVLRLVVAAYGTIVAVVLLVT